MVPVPPYCVAIEGVESIDLFESAIRGPAPPVRPLMVKPFFTLKFLSDNLVHYPLIDIG